MASIIISPGRGTFVTAKGADNDYDSDSFINWRLGASGQYRANQTWAFSGAFEYNLIGDQKLDRKTNGDLDVETDAQWNLDLSAKYNINNDLLLTLGYGLTGAYEQDIKTTTTPTREYDMAHRFTVGGQFLF